MSSPVASWSGVMFRRRMNVPTSNLSVRSRSIAVNTKARASTRKPWAARRDAIVAAVSPATTLNSTSVASVLGAVVSRLPRSSLTSSLTKGRPRALGLS